MLFVCGESLSEAAGPTQAKDQMRNHNIHPAKTCIAAFTSRAEPTPVALLPLSHPRDNLDRPARTRRPSRRVDCVAAVALVYARLHSVP